MKLCSTCDIYFKTYEIFRCNIERFKEQFENNKKNIIFIFHHFAKFFNYGFKFLMDIKFWIIKKKEI